MTDAVHPTIAVLADIRDEIDALVRVARILPRERVEARLIRLAARLEIAAEKHAAAPELDSMERFALALSTGRPPHVARALVLGED